ncbi:MAG: methionyl-tRNA formyltransferase [Clostridia bacterium]|nr:methionyl-tRNA formyltransferase [Clostridia bacterium]
MKIVFAGSPQFAVPALEKLLESGKNVVAVITQPDRPVGRKKVLTPTPVCVAAQKHGLPVYRFEKIKNEVQTLQSLGADIMITCAYGQLLTQPVLDAFSGGVWNIHASLLPLFRGASPIQSAILAGELYTGVTVMKTELSLDTGAMLLVKRCETGNLTCGELTEKLSRLGAEAAAEAVGLLEKGDRQLLMQDEAKATYCKKISKAEGKIDFKSSPARIRNLIKAFSPEPCAYCNFNGEVLNIFNAELCECESGKAGEVVRADKRGIAVKCGDGGILITELQPAGGKRMRAADFVNGRKIKAGDLLD